MLAWILAQSGTDAYMPHGMCYLWEQDLVWLHVVSDTLITLAYWAIPPFLVYLALKGRDEIPASAPYARRRLPYDWMFLAFGVFIVACGATHAMGIWTVWEPRYWLSGGVKAVTAVASVATAIALPPLVPRALDLIREARESEVRRVELERAQHEQEELVRQLREANESKSRFLASVSHDLRTPLSLVQGPVEEILERDDVPEEVREELRTVLRNALTLGGQVENLLALARADTEGMEPELRPLDLAQELRRAAEHYRGHAEGREIDFRVETPESIVGRVDPDLLERALLNLLSNAFDFTPDGGTVRVGLDRADGGRVRIVTADSGPGIPEDERDTVFERFRHGGLTAGRGQGGTGLGLSIVREVAEAHEGHVELDDAPEGGARFTLLLPVEAETPSGAAPTAPDRPEGTGEAARAVEDSGAATTAEEGSEAAGGGPSSRERPITDVAPRHPAREDRDADGAADEEAGRPTVLVVEDDADMARHIGRALAVDVDVAYAADGREGLRTAIDLRPDLILTDLMMPVMDGAELVSELRARSELADVPVLVLTARAEEELPERMLREGVQDYVLKPVRTGELRARVENLLDLTGTRRVLQDALATKEDSLQSLAHMAARRKEELEAAVEQKKLLMKELHHRVKGNLQTITSLLQLQLRRVEDDRARRSLEESRGRVATMGLLHEKLYRSGVPDRVELSGYVRSLVADVVRARGDVGRIRTDLALEEVEVSVDDAVACGLVVHELVSNAVRHAFPADASGTVRVALGRRDGHAVLSVADDGTGVRAEDSEEALGLRLVESLVEQLDGRTRTREDDGTEVEIVFPLGRQESATGIAGADGVADAEGA